MTWRPYPSYKDSGVEWLGKIPAHWSVRRLKTISSVQLSNVDKKSVEGQETVRLCNYLDVYYNERITESMEFMAATATPEQVRRFSLKAGDVMITKDSESWTDIAVPAVVVKNLPGVLCGYHMALIRPYHKAIDGRFLARACAAVGPRDQFHIAANGITRFGLTEDAIKTSLFGLPPIVEQRAIADLLDRETAKIDGLMGKKERLIELLQEERTALITQAVTKGLDPNVPMKDSGIEWLGKIPSHWRILPFKRFFEVIYRYPTYYGIEYVPDGVKEIRGEAIAPDGRIFELKDQRYISPELNAQFGQTILREGDLVMSVRGTMGKVGFVDKNWAGSNITANLMRLSPRRKLVEGRFLIRALSSQYFLQMLDLQAPQTTIKTITVPQLAVIPIPLPPLLEQEQILALLVNELSKIKTLAEGIHKGIAHLKEYRTALITAAVTGKIDVRDTRLTS